MKNVVILSTIILVFLGCKDNHNSQDSLYQFKHPTDTTFKKEIPTTGYSYKSDKYKEKQLGLENLESGFETLQIRLWVDYALYKGKELYIIKNRNGKWTAEVYKMMTGRSVEGEDSIISKEIKNVTPKSGWDSLLTNLLNLKIATLPNMNNILGLVDMIDDGVDFNIEIASKYQYRFYGYHSPEYFQDKFWQAKNMTQIVKLIREELNP
jgi:hypothetical protein